VGRAAEPVLVRITEQGRVHLRPEYSIRRGCRTNGAFESEQAASGKYRLLMMTVNSNRPIKVTLLLHAGPQPRLLLFSFTSGLVVKCSMLNSDPALSTPKAVTYSSVDLRYHP
jgi:hypothetical protein